MHEIVVPLKSAGEKRCFRQRIEFLVGKRLSSLQEKRQLLLPEQLTVAPLAESRFMNLVTSPQKDDSDGDLVGFGFGAGATVAAAEGSAEDTFSLSPPPSHQM